MEFFDSLIAFINSNFIRVSFFSVLSIVLMQRFYRKELNYKLPIVIISWIILGFSSFCILMFIIQIFNAWYGIEYEQYALINQATGPYAIFFWIIFIMKWGAPLFLLKRNLRSNIYFVLFLTIVINFAWAMELSVIISTSLHRDYVQPNLSLLPLLVIPFQGILLGVAILFISNRPMFILNKSA